MADAGNTPCHDAEPSCYNSCVETTCENCSGDGECQTCQKCDSGCQSSCETNDETYSGKKISEIFDNFSFSIVPQANTTQMGSEEGMFNASVWNELAVWINKRTELPVDELKTDTEGCYDWVKENNPIGGTEVLIQEDDSYLSPFTAYEFNRIASAVDGPTVKGAYSTENADGKGDLITAAIFADLVTAANNKTVDAVGGNKPCKHCNANCDLTCDACQKCDDPTCQDCDTCESCDLCDSSCEDVCESCDVCEGCDSCESCDQAGGSTTPTDP